MGAYRLQAVAVNAAGNTSGVSAAQSLQIVAAEPDLVFTLQNITADGRLNRAEAQAGVLLGGEIETGATVSVHIAGRPEQAAWVEAGRWSYRLSAADLSALKTAWDAGVAPQVLQVVAVSATGSKTLSTTLPVYFDAPTLHVVVPPEMATITAAGLALAATDPAGLTLTGTSSAAVTLRLPNLTEARAVTQNTSGEWAYTLTATDLAAMGQGLQSLQVLATDLGGNVTTETVALRVATLAPEARIEQMDDQVFSDG